MSQEMPSAPGQFGRYELISELGAGGMGKVFLALDRRLNRRVALKIPFFSGDRADETLQRFRREAELAASIHHPNVCPIFDIDEVDGVNYLTMPFVEGQSLSSALKRKKRFPPEEALQLMAKVSDGIQAAHAKDIVHRDLKPDNIMLDGRGEPIVMDFGLAKSRRSQQHLSAPNAVMGTMPYMSPEQIQGLTDQVNSATDIYTVGVILFELLTGRLPFEGDSYPTLLRQVVDAPAPSLRATSPDVPQPLEKLVHRLLAKQASHRPGSMAAVATELRGILKSQQTGQVLPETIPTGNSTPIAEGDAGDADTPKPVDPPPAETGSGDRVMEPLPVREPVPVEPRVIDPRLPVARPESTDIEVPVLPQRASRPLKRTTVAPFRSKRLLSKLRIHRGCRQIILSGQITDIFAIDLFHGSQPLDRALEIFAAERQYACVIFISSEGTLRFPEPSMQRLFNETTRRESADPQRGQQERRQFVPRPRDDQPQPRAAEETDNRRREEAVGQVVQAAANNVQTTLDQVTRMLESSHQTLVIVHDPHLMCGLEVNEQGLAKLRTILTWTRISTGNRRNASILIVSDELRDRFESLATLTGVAGRQSLTEEIALGLPDQEELECCLQRIIVRRQLTGNVKRLATSARAMQQPLRSFIYHVADFLDNHPGQTCLDGMFADEDQAMTLDELLDELDAMVGLQPVKTQIRQLVNQAANQPEAVRAAPQHMFFLGNPGTGKTVAARLVGQLLWATGIRSRRAFVACTKKDIISPFNEGDTIERMQALIHNAMGGVLFIDEFYTLADHPWGRAAIEVLMVAMEDHRSELTVILAGYADRLQDFLRVNPGLESRVPHRIDFPDYSLPELMQIFDRMADKAGYTIHANAIPKLHRLLQAALDLGGLDNGRGVRNVLDTTLRRMGQTASSGVEILPEYLPDPVVFNEAESRRILEEIDLKFRGLNKVKELLRNLFATQKLNHERGGRRGETTHHCLCLGNPGTGKTSLVRKMGRLFHALGLIPEAERFVEIHASHLDATHVGEYAERTRDKFEEARGGILFIDEAYEFANMRQGSEIIGLIVQLMTQPRYRNMMLVMAGYADEMREMLRVNSGLESRFAHQILFEDLPVDALAGAFYDCLRNHTPALYVPEEAAGHFESRLNSVLQRMSRQRRFGNVRDVKKFFETVVKANQSRRLSESSGADLLAVLPEDLDGKSPEHDESIDTILQEFDEKFVGLQPVKDQIRRFARRVQMDIKRGGKSGKTSFYHMRFVGNPGTGKTTVARYMSRILCAIGIVSRPEVIEVRGVDLKGSVLGETKDKVNQLFEKGSGAVILIDEAYSLYQPMNGRNDPYGQEAIDTLVGCLTDQRNLDTVVIVAGYPNPMSDFMSANPGLERRFPFAVEFPNYTIPECLEIMQRLATSSGFRFDDQRRCNQLLLQLISAEVTRPDFGNAGSMGNLWDQIVDLVNERLDRSNQYQPDEMSLVLADDIQDLIAMRSA